MTSREDEAARLQEQLTTIGREWLAQIDAKWETHQRVHDTADATAAQFREEWVHHYEREHESLRVILAEAIAEVDRRAIAADEAAKHYTEKARENLHERIVEVRDVCTRRDDITAELLNAQIDQLRRETGMLFQASDRAITKAELANEKRFEATNEFRAQLAEQARDFMPRREAESRTAATAEKVDALVAQFANIMSRAEIEQRIAVGREAIESLTNRVERMTGVTSGADKLRERANQTYGWVIAAASLLVSISLVVVAIISRR